MILNKKGVEQVLRPQTGLKRAILTKARGLGQK
jgi:hypothetical protein